VKVEAELRRLEAIVDASGIAPRIEALLPVGVRPRQLRVRTLLVGMLSVAVAGRPAHLSRVHEALLSLPEADRRRLGVLAEWKGGPHELTYRQVERTFSLVARALAKAEPDGEPSEALSEIIDALLEASVEICGDPETSSYAVDWTDLETFSVPPPKGGGSCADPEAAWGHRRGDSPGERDEVFYGYYLQVATVVGEERGPAVAELVRRIQIGSCDVDPPPALVPVLERMVEGGIELGDVLADSGYAHRVAERWALPVRRLGASLVQDLHPHDRGPKGTHMGATLAGGALYCPATPGALLELGPLARGVGEEETATHDRKAAELARHKLSPIAGYDEDGYHRVGCPAARGQAALPLAARVDGARAHPSRGGIPARAPARLLCPAHDHGAPVGQREDRAKARLPLALPPPLLRAALGRRARLRDGQGPGLQRPLKGLVPADGPRPGRALCRLRLRRPQPARRRRLRGASSRGRAACPERAAAQAAQAPPQERSGSDRGGQRAALRKLAAAAGSPSSVSCQTALSPALIPERSGRSARCAPLANPGERLTADQTDHGAAVRCKREDEWRSKVKTSRWA
jgi:hypothetical protein